jgi:hypothetical protein
MQKVEGSSPFIRFEKARKDGPFLISDYERRGIVSRNLPPSCCDHSLRSRRRECDERATNPAARERMEALVGEWTMEAKPPGGPPWPGGGRVTFEWLEAVPLLIERSHADMPEAPDGVTVIGYDGISGTYY